MTAEPGARLVFSLTSTPDTLTPATATDRRKGRLEITAALDNAGTRDQSLRCRSLTVTIPTGSAPDRLTHQPERINTGFRSRRTWWHISKNTTDPQATVFTLRPQNPRREAVFDDASSVTLVLDRIPLTTRPGTIDIRVTAETAIGTGDIGGAGAFARTTASLQLTVHEVSDATTATTD
jgi:hypothetical protein